MDAYGILVIILSITLAILLVVCIVLGIALTKLVNQVRDITTKAEEIMDDVEAVSGFFRKTAAPVAVTSMISNIISKVTQHNSKRGGKND